MMTSRKTVLESKLGVCLPFLAVPIYKFSNECDDHVLLSPTEDLPACHFVLDSVGHITNTLQSSSCSSVAMLGLLSTLHVIPRFGDAALSSKYDDDNAAGRDDGDDAEYWSDCSSIKSSIGTRRISQQDKVLRTHLQGARPEPAKFAILIIWLLLTESENI